jgi:ribosomal protein L11 methyltransferase
MQKVREWVEIIVHMSPASLEIICPVIMELDADGIQELDDRFKIYFPADKWNKNKETKLINTIKQYFPEFSKTSVEKITIPYEDWNESWKDSFRTFKVTEKLVIRPDWEEYLPSGDECVIVIAPKMAFGTGHHETTQLVLRMMEKYVKKGQKVLDAGTGSGVLAIYAAMLGAKSLVAFDIDPVAIENTRENFELNKIETPHKIFAGEISQVSGRFDMLLANIDRNILLDLAQDFTARSEPGGMVILSGLLHSDRDVILNRYSELGWKLLESDRKNEWITLVMKNEHTG